MAKRDQSMKFFCFVCFGIPAPAGSTLQGKELSEIIIKCANKAYQDLKRRVPYRLSSAEAESIKNRAYKDKKTLFKKQVAETIVNAIVKSGSLIEEESIKPVQIIQSVYELQKKDDFEGLFTGEFTIGLAQKWVNMTLKYLWILNIIEDGDSLDAPIDSNIIKAATAKKTGCPSMGLGIDYGMFKNNPQTSWSRWTDLNEYVLFQKEIECAAKDLMLTKIRWENEAWIEFYQ